MNNRLLCTVLQGSIALSEQIISARVAYPLEIGAVLEIPE